MQKKTSGKNNTKPVVLKVTTEDVEFIRTVVSAMNGLHNQIADNEEQRFVLQQKNVQLLQQRAAEREKKNGRIQAIIRQAGQDPTRSWFLDFNTAEIRLME